MAQQPFKIVENHQKKMPCNIEAEQAVIGSILISNDIYDEISPIIDSQKFYDPIHKKIFETIEKLISKGLLANPITLKNYFENNEGLKELGGQEYLIKITKFSTTSVKQVIDMVEKVTGLVVPFIIDSRRVGDPPILIADSSKARVELSWNPVDSSLENIVESAWLWYKKMKERDIKI